jgi:hypothetical protein
MSVRKLYVTYNNEGKAKSLIGDFANHSHYSRTVEDDCEVILCEPSDVDDHGQEIRLIGRTFSGEISREATAKAYAHIKTVDTPVTNRFNVAGKGSALPRKRQDGSYGDTTEVPKAVQEIMGFSDVVGYLPPDIRTPYGRLSGWTRRHRGARKALEPALREVDDLFYKAYPSEHRYQATWWPENGVYNFYGGMSDETAFAACYVNNEVRSAYHRDGRNADFSALFTMGKYEGGGIVLPQFGLRFNLQPGGLLLLNGNDVHGVLPYTGTRCSAVFFIPCVDPFTGLMENEDGEVDVDLPEPGKEVSILELWAGHPLSSETPLSHAEGIERLPKLSNSLLVQIRDEVQRGRTMVNTETQQALFAELKRRGL